MTITIPTTETYQITVWTYNFGGSGTFSATLPGATSYTDTTSILAKHGDPKATYSYTLTATPDAVNGTDNVLSIQNLLVTDDTGKSNTNVGDQRGCGQRGSGALFGVPGSPRLNDTARIPPSLMDPVS